MQPLHFAHDQELEIFVLKKDIKILSLQSYFHFSLKIYILLGILCLKSSFRSVLDFRVVCLSLRNFENSRTFSSLAFSGGLSINGDDDGARAQTDESTSFGLSNCSRIAGSPISEYVKIVSSDLHGMLKFRWGIVLPAPCLALLDIGTEGISGGEKRGF